MAVDIPSPYNHPRIAPHVTGCARELRGCHACVCARFSRGEQWCNSLTFTLEPPTVVVHVDVSRTHSCQASDVVVIIKRDCETTRSAESRSSCYPAPEVCEVPDAFVSQQQRMNWPASPTIFDPVAPQGVRESIASTWVCMEEISATVAC